MYSNLNQGNFSRRPHEGGGLPTYFEDSPDLNLRQGAIHNMNQELQGGYPSRFNEGK